MRQQLIGIRRVFTLLATVATIAAAQDSVRARTTHALIERWTIPADSTLFAAPGSLAVTGTCAVWIVDQTTGVWRAPCDGGTPLHIARVGSGAGEFGQPILGALVGRDTVVVYDRLAQQLVYFTATGEFLRSRPLVYAEQVFGRLQQFAPAPGGGRVLGWTARLPTPADKSQRSYALVFGANGVVRDSSLKLAPLRSVTFETSFAAGRFDAPAQRRPFVAYFRSGSFLTGNNDSATVVLRDSAGHVTRSVLLPMPEASVFTRVDRAAYADSVRRSSAREADALQYDGALKTRYLAAIDSVLASLEYPSHRQRYDHLLLDDREESVWILLPAVATDYARTWMVCTLTELSVCRTLRAAHEGAVVAAAVREGTLFVIERALDGVPRVASYGSR